MPLTHHLPEHRAFNYRFSASDILEGWNEVIVYNGGGPIEGANAAASEDEICIVSIELAVTPRE